MVIIRNRQELIDHVADITGRRDIITEAMEALDTWQGLTPSEQAATEKFLNLPPAPEPEAATEKAPTGKDCSTWAHIPGIQCEGCGSTTGSPPLPEPEPEQATDANGARWAAQDAQHALWEKVEEAYIKAIVKVTKRSRKDIEGDVRIAVSNDGESGELQISASNYVPSTEHIELWTRITETANKTLKTDQYWHEFQNAATVHVYNNNS